MTTFGLDRSIIPVLFFSCHPFTRQADRQMYSPSPWMRPRAITSNYVTSAQNIPLFTDQLEKHWAWESIRELVNLCYVNGFPDGSFRADDTMSSAYYAALLVNAFNPQPRSDRPPKQFQDVPSSHPQAEVIQKAYRGGLMSGKSDTNFAPNQPVTIIQVMASLVAALNLPDGDPQLLKKFTDIRSLPSWVRPGIVAAAVKAAIVTGHPVTELRPMANATRAEVTTLLRQALKQR
jgi:hypothetical protein